MKKIFSILPLLLCAAMAMAEDCLVLVPLSGDEQATAISEIGYLSFEGDNLVLFDQSGDELGRTPLGQVRKIVFADTTPSPKEGLTNAEVGIRVYPNPTADWLTVDGADDRQTIRIYTLDGQLVSATAVQAGQATVNVSTLTRGDYLLQVGAEVVKFIKK